MYSGCNKVVSTAMKELLSGALTTTWMDARRPLVFSTHFHTSWPVKVIQNILIPHQLFVQSTKCPFLKPVRAKLLIVLGFFFLSRNAVVTLKTITLLPICQSVNIDGHKVIHACMAHPLIWERNEILFPQSPRREIICHASRPSISAEPCNKCDCVWVCVWDAAKRSLQVIASSFPL